MIDRTHGGNIAEFIERYHISQDKIIDFSANINPLGLSKKVKEVILKNVNTLVHYPEPTSSNLKKKLANFHNIKSENLLIGNGSVELIYLIPKALPPKSAIIPIPSFSEYEFAVKLNGAKSIFVRLREKDDFAIGMDKFEKFIPRADLIFICNPNSPTGNLFPRGDMLYLIKLCKKYNTTIVVDETFIDFVENAENITMIPEAIKKNNLLILRSLTKFFALAGLRLGYAIGRKDTISKLAQFQHPWAVNSLAQTAAKTAIGDYDYIKKSRQFVFKERAFLRKRLKAIKGLRVYPPTSNFILCKLTDRKINAEMLSKKLAHQGLIIRNCNNFRGLTNRFFRLAVRKRNENIRLIRALREMLG